MKDTKTMTEHLETGAKYAGSAGVLALAIVNMLVHFFPSVDAIKLDLLTLLTFGINMLAIYVIKSIEVAE